MVANEETTHSISDLRRRTRLGMGTCQGTFCTYRAVGTVQGLTDRWSANTKELFKEFLEARWKGIRPVMWGNQLKDVELTRGIYEVSLNINHEDDTLYGASTQQMVCQDAPAIAPAAQSAAPAAPTAPAADQAPAQSAAPAAAAPAEPKKRTKKTVTKAGKEVRHG